VTDEEIAETSELFGGNMSYPENFEITAPIHRPNEGRNAPMPPEKAYINPQTSLLCEMLDLTNPFGVLSGKTPERSVSFNQSISVTYDSDGDEEDEGVHDGPSFSMSNASLSFVDSDISGLLQKSSDPCEISLDDIDEDEEEEPAAQTDSSVDLKNNPPADSSFVLCDSFSSQDSPLLPKRSNVPKLNLPAVTGVVFSDSFSKSPSSSPSRSANISQEDVLKDVAASDSSDSPSKESTRTAAKRTSGGY